MTELHVHLDGSLRPESVREMAEEQDILLGAKDCRPESLADMLTVPADCRDLNQYLACFDLPLQVLQEPEYVARAVTELVQDMAAEGVMQAEIRFAPQLHGKKSHTLTDESVRSHKNSVLTDTVPYTQKEITEGAIRGLREGTALCTGFQGGLILCCMRGGDNQKANEETLRTASAFLGSGVCAVDLAGAEALYPTSGYEALFAQARKLGLPFTIHAGEADGAESVWDALRFGAKRIGHGVRSVEDPELCRYLVKHRIPLEVCYTSNLQTKAMGGEMHPIRRLFDMGVHVTVNTDNRTVSNTTMAQERKLLQEAFGFTEKEFAVMEEYAREGCFL